MVQKLSATVEIGAALSDSFGKSFSTAESHIKKFGASLSAFKQAENDIRSLISAETALKQAQDANSAALREYGKLLRLKNMKRSAEATEKFNANLAAQKAKVEQARAALDKQQGTVRKLGETLRKSGIDTKNLSAEMERLARGSVIARQRMQMMNSLRGLNLGPIASRVLPSLMMRFPAFGKAMQSMAPALAEALPLLGAAAGWVAAIAAAGVAAAYGMFKLGKAFSDFVDDNQDAADGLGLSLKNLIELRYAAGDAGIEAEKFDQQLSKMSQSLQSAVDGSKEQKRAFEELGLDATTLQTMNLDEQFKAVAEGFKNYRGDVSKAAIAQDIFGKGSSRLLGVLNKGEAGLNSYAERAKKAGLIPSDEDIRRAEAFDRQWNDFHATLMGLRNTFGSELLPGLTKYFSEITTWLQANGPEIRETAQGIGNAVKWIADNAMLIYKIEWNTVMVPLRVIWWTVTKIVDALKLAYDLFQQMPTIGLGGAATAGGGGMSATWAYSPPKLAPAGVGGNTTNNSNRTINVTVNAAPGMNERSLADYTVEEIDRLTVEQGLLHDVK